MSGEDQAYINVEMVVANAADSISTLKRRYAERRRTVPTSVPRDESLDSDHAYLLDIATALLADRTSLLAQLPDFSHVRFQYQDKNDADGPSFWWINPWSGQREKIASLLWPTHPPSETHVIEKLFERLHLIVAAKRSESSEPLTDEAIIDSIEDGFNAMSK